MQERISPGAEHDFCRSVLAAQQEEILTLKRRVEELENRVGKNSRNSSKPPSSDPPWMPPPKGQITSNRKPGGQPGHPPHQRPPVPPDQLDQMVAVRPKDCRGCGAPLVGSDTDPIRHQVVEIPPIDPETIEYRLHRLMCGRCGVTTCADLPRGVPEGQWGPRLSALIAYLSVRARMSKRQIQELLSELLGIPISLGAIVAAEQRVSAALGRPYEATLAAVRQSRTINADETGWAQKGRLCWLWTAVTPKAAVFRIDPKRSAAAADRLLGDFDGILGSDRLPSYNHGPPTRRRQLCWAHLVRDFRGMVDRRQGAQGLGTALLDLTRQMFELWHRFREGALSWKGLRGRLSRVKLRQTFDQVLMSGRWGRDRTARAVCHRLMKAFRHLWTFTEVRGVEPTNNAAERELRPAVIYRKGCFGTQSDAGSRFVERLLTANATLRKQGRSVLDYLARACRAHFARRTVPSLVTP